MIRLTERAAHGLKAILAANRTPKNQGVKLVRGEQGRASMTIGSAAEGDSVVDGGRRPLLIVDASIVDVLDGIVLDLDWGGQEGGSRFVFRREPAAT